MPLEHALQTRGLFPDLGPWKTTPVRQASLNRPLGMEALPRQKYNKAKRTPFQLNLMVVGETGLGKSTFMNTLFHSDLYESEAKVPQDTKTVEITPVTYELEEGGVTLRLCVIDTPGFGDRLNRNADLEPILTYIDEQYDRFHEAEKNASFRGALVDSRVHACLYFIAPTGHRLKELDIMSLRAISAKVNVIPVIAKADTLTPEEKILFKEAILEDLQEHEIKMYPTAFPDDRDEIEELEKHIPFTVIGSTSYVDVNGKQVRGRQYRWGAVEVENPDHCDFIHLRELLMTHCLHELTDLTHHHHYHAHRARRLRGPDRPESLLMCDEEYDSRIENMKSDLKQEMLSKEEDMRQQFVQKVRETEQVLKQREEALQEKRQELMKELEEQKKQLETTERELNDMRNATLR
ncbi:septin 2 [Apophysomyces ossiformis]|uniref:Septin 2 n=1 Tax=Apophysomyces ossiformis TaxID=679940 RepID=A0A8H7BLX5_9FUNG|nr:septin 2 [Apophysomyces ossiformis]